MINFGYLVGRAGGLESYVEELINGVTEETSQADLLRLSYLKNQSEVFMSAVTQLIQSDARMRQSIVAALRSSV